MRASHQQSALPITNPRNSRHRSEKDFRNVKAFVNSLLLLIALFLAGDLLFGWRKAYSSRGTDWTNHELQTEESKLDCARPVRLHNAFSSLCHPGQPGIVYSARFGGLGGWELEILHSGDFASTFHVFDPTPLISERQGGIEYHALGLGLQEENVTLAPPSRPERTYSFMGNQTYAVPSDKTLSVGVESLETLMLQFGHTHLAMLHLDLGGMETVLVDGWLKMSYIPQVDQIVIRFSEKPFVVPGQQDPIHDAIHIMEKLGFRMIDAWETVS